MAEDTTIPLDGGSASSSPAEDLATSPADETTDAATLAEAAAPDTSRLEAQIAELSRLNEQYKRERRGWEEQSRRNLDERNAMAERFARLEGQLTGLAQGRTDPPAPQYTPGQMTAALEKYMGGDASAMTQAEQALWATMQQAVQQGQPQSITADQVKKIILDELVTLGTKGNVTTAVGTNHPDLSNPRSDLSRATWDQYDDYASNPAVQVMYPHDPRFEVPWTSADGQQRLVDARIIDRLAADIRLKNGHQEGRKQEQRAQAVGGAMAGNGQTTRAPQTRSVEAIELLTEGELVMLQNPAVRKGWSTMPENLRRATALSPAETKAAAKFLLDKLPAAVREERLARWRRDRGG